MGVGDEPMEEGSTPSESNDKGKAKEAEPLEERRKYRTRFRQHLQRRVITEDRKKYLPPRLHTPAAGIMPLIDSIRSIPTAFGAICLNASSLALFQTSGALETFFEIFESTDHIQYSTEHELASLLGSKFDKLVWYHPVLRENVINVVIEMLERV